MLIDNPAPAPHHFDRAQFEVATRINVYVAAEASTRARLDASPNDPIARTAWLDARDRATHWQRPEAVEKFAGMLAFFEHVGL